MKKYVVYEVQGKGGSFMPEEYGWHSLGRAAGIDIPWLGDKDKAMKLLERIKAQSSPDVEYRLIAKEIKEEVIA